MASAHTLTVHSTPPVRGVVTYVKALGNGNAEVHLLTSGWLDVGTYRATYSAPNGTVDGSYAVIGYENGVAGNWVFKGTFRRDTP
jgi:hypothetical protein